MEKSAFWRTFFISNITYILISNQMEHAPSYLSYTDTVSLGHAPSYLAQAK